MTLINEECGDKMRIALDTDGTLTDFRAFLQKNAFSYFKNRYGFKVVYPDKCEIEDILDMTATISREGNCSEEKAKNLVRKILNKYWVGFRFVQFSLLSRFRKGASKTINELIKQGHEIRVFTSRAKTCEKSIVGAIARDFTIWQYRLNGIWLPRRCFNFYADDKDKVDGILSYSPQIAFDDKPEIVCKISEAGIPVICIAGEHNHDVTNSNFVEKTNDFDYETIRLKMKKLFGNKLSVYDREAKSCAFISRIRLFRPVILAIFKPIILNNQNITQVPDSGIVYAPNHRSTLDPIVITTYLGQNIHWAALLRFFEAKDSIFANSKNPILCRITSRFFKTMEYFPIERKSDNPQANSFSSIKDMYKFLKINSRVGIFSEGTTKRPEGKTFGTFDSGFILLAKQSHALIQPVTTVWTEKGRRGSKVIVNFGEAFRADDMSIEEAMDHYMRIQERSMNENLRVVEDNNRIK